MTTSEIVLLIVIALLLIAVAWLGATKDSLESQMRGEIENLKVTLLCEKSMGWGEGYAEGWNTGFQFGKKYKEIITRNPEAHSALEEEIRKIQDRQKCGFNSKEN